MNTIGAPPQKQPFTDEEGHATAWKQWFSELRQILNTAQATGTTLQRPAVAPWVGFPYFDTTLNRPIWAKTQTPATWVFADGSAA